MRMHSAYDDYIPHCSIAKNLPQPGASLAADGTSGGPYSWPIAQRLAYRVRETVASGEAQRREQQAREGHRLQSVKAVELERGHGVAANGNGAQHIMVPRPLS